MGLVYYQWCFSLHSNTLSLEEKMIYIETHNNLNKILLLAVGLWPYQQSRFTQFQFIFFYTILLADIIFQVQNHIKLS